VRENKLSRQREAFRPISKIEFDLAEEGDLRAAHYSVAVIASHMQSEAMNAIRLAGHIRFYSPSGYSIPVGSGDGFLIRCLPIFFDVVFFVIREGVIRLR
jgi:hypothetical protein